MAEMNVAQERALALARARARIAASGASGGQQAEATPAEAIAASPATRFAYGTAEPFVGGSQVISRGANAIESTASGNPLLQSALHAALGIGGFRNIAQGVANAGERMDQLIRAGRQANEPQNLEGLITGKRPEPGFDYPRFAGNVLSPVYGLMAAGAPIEAGAGLLRQAGQGARLGAAGGATQPVYNTQGGPGFAVQKGLQTVGGGVAGGVLTPVISKVLTPAVKFLGNKFANREVIGARASLQTDKALKDAMAEIGQTTDHLQPAQVSMLRQEVVSALKAGRQPDVASMIRSKDFQALGMQPTLGQVTRNATQYARERNLRGVAGVGDPLMQRFEQQGRQLQDAVAGYGGQAASEPQVAGQRIVESLANVDSGLQKQVSAAYDAARQATGRDLQVPLQGLAQDVQKVIRDYGKQNVPQALRSALADYGIFGGKQTKMFTFNDAEQVLQQINKLSDPAKKAEYSALGSLRNAVKNAMLNADASGGPFAEARNLAAQRFKLHELVPALDAAANGTVNADTFVNKYITNASTKDVRSLAQLLSQSDAAAFQEAKNQLGARIQEAAFGTNLTGDKSLAPERLAKFLAKIGTQKLEAFYSPQEIEQLRRIARVGAYINQIPNAAPVNTSNTAAAAANLIGANVPMGGRLVRALGAVASPVVNSLAVNRALAANVPTVSRELTTPESMFLRSILSGSAVGGGLLATQR